MAHEPSPTFLNTAQAAAYLGVSERSLRRLRMEGEGPNFARVGGKVGYEPAALDAWLTACRLGQNRVERIRHSLPGTLFERASSARPSRALTRTKSKTMRLGPLLIAATASAALIGTATIAFTPRLLWNGSASAPTGLYRVHPITAPVKGDMVAAWAPASARRLAARRHYLPENIPLIKRIAALSPDRICALGSIITINGQMAARRLARDSKGRVMPWWTGCRTLATGDAFLLMSEHRNSFDGRYFGVTRRGDMLGIARPLWVS